MNDRRKAHTEGRRQLLASLAQEEDDQPNYQEQPILDINRQPTSFGAPPTRPVIQPFSVQGCKFHDNPASCRYYCKKLNQVE